MADPLPPFSPDALHHAVQAALQQNPLPPDKHFALVATATTSGITAQIVQRLGDTWTWGGEVAWHGGDVEAGVNIVASW